MQVNIGEGVGVDAQLVMTGRGCIIGQSGSGKSYLVGVIAEELCRLRLPFVIVDVEGEYSSLKEHFGAVWAGEDRRADVNLGVDFGGLFSESIRSGVPVVLDVSDSLDREACVYSALGALYEIEERERAPYLVIIEEADKFAPQVVRPRVGIIDEISTRGRKRGMGLLTATQRPANISKNVLSQCSYGFIGKLTIDNDLQAISILFNERGVLERITELQTGTFMPFGIGRTGQFKARQRLVKHIGSTPLVGERQTREESVDRIIAAVRSGKAAQQTGRAQQHRQGRDVRIEAFAARIDEAGALDIASRLAAKRYLLFGPASESVDPVRVRFAECTLCGIRTPTGRKNEYRESYAVLMGGGLVRMGKHTTVRMLPAERGARVGAREAKVISELAAKGKAKAGWLSKRLNVTEAAARREAERLVRAGIIERHGDAYSIGDYGRDTDRHRPETESVKIGEDRVKRSGEKDRRRAAAAVISRILPASRLFEAEEVYLPFYEITLRKGGKVRVFTIDAVNGDEIVV